MFFRLGDKNLGGVFIFGVGGKQILIWERWLRRVNLRFHP